MTVSLKHTFVSNVADSSDTSLVQPSNWNAEHTLTAAADTLLGAVTAGAVTEITCTSAGRALLDDADAAAQRTTLAAAGAGVTNTFTANQIISVTDNTNAALRVTQLGTGDAFVVEDSANPDSSPFVINAVGNVGVGYAPLAYSKIGVKNDRASTTYSLVVDNYNGVNFENSFVLQYDGTGTQSLGNYQAANLAFLTNNTERMRILSTGLVGIGKTNPATPLDMAGQFRATDSSVDFRIIPLNAGNATIIGNASSSDFVFYTNNTERMRIGSGGVVLMGTSTIGAGILNISNYQDGTFYGIFMVPTSNTATPLAFTNASQTVIGTITTTSSATSYNTSSDYRLKEKEVSMHDASARLMSLRPINFAWKSDGSRSDGFLAHEVQTVIPEAVTGKKDAIDADGNPIYQVMDQSKIVPVITAALQDTIKRVSILERRLDSNHTQEQK